MTYPPRWGAWARGACGAAWQRQGGAVGVGKNAEFQNTGGIPRLLAEFHGFSVNSTLLRDFQLLSPISTRYQVEFANSNPDREFQPKTRIPRRLAPRSLGDVGRFLSLRVSTAHHPTRKGLDGAYVLALRRVTSKYALQNGVLVAESTAAAVCLPV